MSHCCQSIEPAAAGASAGAARSHSAPLPWWRLIVAIVLAGNLMVFSLAVNVGHAAPNHRLFLHVVLAAVTLLVAELVGRPLLRGSWRSLVERRVAVEQLFVLGVVGALGLSVAAVVAGEGDVYFEVVAILLVIYALGAQLKSRSQQRSLAQLRTWLPVDETARVRRCCGKESVVPVEDVALGATVVVHPGTG